MPGFALWLVPPEDSPLYKVLHAMILTHIPSIYPHASPARFTPHITLTSDCTLPDDIDQQAWLDSIALPDNLADLRIHIKGMQREAAYFRKLTLMCEKTATLCELAVRCRAAGVEG
ncbi:hypothetical protein LTR53_019302, partial [Teratosphaeriaceae sp. CCFEE 6253]